MEDLESSREREREREREEFTVTRSKQNVRPNLQLKEFSLVG